MLSCSQAQSLASEKTDNEQFPVPDSSYFSDECVNACGKSNEKVSPLKDPQREVLSPINPNSGRSQFLPSEPKTPNIHPVQSVDEFGTPLDKFTARSSRLKVLPLFKLVAHIFMTLHADKYGGFLDRILLSKITLNS